MPPRDVEIGQWLQTHEALRGGDRLPGTPVSSASSLAAPREGEQTSTDCLCAGSQHLLALPWRGRYRSPAPILAPRLPTI